METQEELWDHALNAYYQGDFETAIQCFSKYEYLNTYINFRPTHKIIYYNRGLCFLKISEYNAAVADFTKMIASGTNFADVFNNRGICYVELKEFERAMEDYNQAISLNPMDADFYFNRGQCFSELKHWKEAIWDFNKAIVLRPMEAMTYYNRGLCFEENQEINKAIADYSVAIQLNPHYDEAFAARGLCFYHIQAYSKSLADFNQVIALQPMDAEAYNNRGLCYLQLKQYLKVLNDFSKAIALDSNDADYYHNRGLCYLELKEYTEALADFTKAIELKPNEADFYYNRGQLYWQFEEKKDHLKKANEDFQRFVYLYSPKQKASKRLLKLFPFYEKKVDAPMFVRQMINKITQFSGSELIYQKFIERVDERTDPFLSFFSHKQANKQNNDYYFSMALSFYYLGDMGRVYDIFTKKILAEKKILNLAQCYYYSQVTSIIGITQQVNLLSLFNDCLNTNCVNEIDLYYFALICKQVGKREEANELFRNISSFLPALYQQLILADENKRAKEKEQLIKLIVAKEGDNQGFRANLTRSISPQCHDYLEHFMTYAHYREVEKGIRLINGKNYQAKAIDEVIRFEKNSQTNVFRKEMVKE